MSCTERWVDFNCDFASIITIAEIISPQVLPVTCLTVVLK